MKLLLQYVTLVSSALPTFRFGFAHYEWEGGWVRIKPKSVKIKYQAHLSSSLLRHPCQL
jgi:hypothetical protein